MITDAAGRVVQFAYDGAGRVTGQTFQPGTPDERVVTYTYDANGNLTSVTPPGRPAHAFDYTPVSLESLYAPPAAGLPSPNTQYAYNLDRQLDFITRPDGEIVDFTYDPAGRLDLITLPGGESRDYEYYTAAEPSPGNLKRITTRSNGVPVTTLDFGHDGFLPTSETWTGTDIATATVTRTYDNNFWLTALQVNAETPVALGYDDDGLLTQAGALTLTRAPANGLLTGTTLTAGANTLTDNRVYTMFGELDLYQAGLTTTNDLYEADYERDRLGRITQKTETIEGVEPVNTFYRYDAVGRLWRVCANQDCTSIQSAYLYDANGNRLAGSFTTHAGALLGATYDDQDRLVAWDLGLAAFSYSYTADGELASRNNVTTNSLTTYSYDALGNLRRVVLHEGQPGEQVIDYLVDGRNRRIGKKLDSQLVQQWVYKDQLAPIAELDGSGNLVAQFIYGSKPNVPDYLIKAGVVYRVLSDHLGSPRLVVEVSTGTIAQRIDYDEFGNATLVEGAWDVQPFGFAGGLYDPDTGLVRFGARDYDPETGRWTAKDPIRFKGGDTNLYGYVLNDPVNAVDILGLSACRTQPPGPGEDFVRLVAGEAIEATAIAIEAGAAVLAASGTPVGRALAAPVAILGAALGAIGADILPGVDLPIIDDADPCECTP